MINNEKYPLISIVLPVYNGERFLAQSIESCLKQSYKNIELIIVNDCSTDKSLEIALSFKATDNRIQIISNTSNKKLPASLNIGHRAAKGEFISWTSDDNIYEKNAIEVLHKTLMETKKDIAYSNINIINVNAIILRQHTFPDIENILFGNIIGSCFLYKVNVFVENKGYDENLFLLEDYDFWLKSVTKFSFIKVEQFLYNYRKHEASLTHHIAISDDQRKLHHTNLNVVLQSFFNCLQPKECILMVNFTLCEMTVGQNNFDWFIKYKLEITRIITSFSRNRNFSKNKLKNAFMQRAINGYLGKSNRNIKDLLFIFTTYCRQLKLKDLKTLVKHLFYK